MLFLEPLHHPGAARKPRCPSRPGPAWPWEFPSGTGWLNKGVRQQGLVSKAVSTDKYLEGPRRRAGEQTGWALGLHRDHRKPGSFCGCHMSLRILHPQRKQLKSPTFPVLRKHRSVRNTPAPTTTKPLSRAVFPQLGGGDQTDNGHFLVVLLALHLSLPTFSVFLWGITPTRPSTLSSVPTCWHSRTQLVLVCLFLCSLLSVLKSLFFLIAEVTHVHRYKKVKYFRNACPLKPCHSTPQNPAQAFLLT